MLKKILIIIGGLLIAICLCVVNAEFINTKQLTADEKVIVTDKLLNTDELLITYFSDLHYGNYIDDEFLNKVINKINDFDSDIIIFGGDLIDQYSYSGISERQKEHLIEGLKSLTANYGKYAVFGEDDIGSDGTLDNIKAILEEADFKIIDGKNILLNVGKNDYINLVGVNSLAYSDELLSKSFESINSNYYTLVVSHYPDMYKMVRDYSFDYMLAGHSHGGQIYFPLISLLNREEGCEEYYRGEIDKTLDISNGVGRTGINARFNADAEINVYRLEKQN